MTAKVFIDGEAGTTGLQIRERLARHSGVDIVSIDPAKRKDLNERAKLLNDVDIVVLCLPDAGATEALSMIKNNRVRIIDASTAHRTVPGWVYGFPEMNYLQRQKIAEAKRVTNPGCYATGAVAILRPLIDAAVIPQNAAITILGVSGYSGGGRSMIEEFEDPNCPGFTSAPFRIYGLGLKHKHVPEIEVHTGLGHRPLFMPSVGRYAQGMIVEVPLDLAKLQGAPTLSSLHDVLLAAYADERFVHVVPQSESRAITTLEPEQLNGTNDMRLYVFGSEENRQAVVVAVLDNLGKGASGQAVQNLNIMLGLPEADGLILEA
ncbi:MAG: N-acetyl-gamma-glutamyl-phosphate reductase [Rhodospirillaceae bacterium]